MDRQRCLPSMFRRQRGGGAHESDAVPCEEIDAEEAYEVVLFEEEGLGPEALEARGDRFAARARRRGATWWFVTFRKPTGFAIADDYKEAALSYVLANNWRKAASAYGHQAVYILKVCFPEEKVNAALALVHSARCYKKIPDKDEGELAAAKIALQKAMALYIENNSLQHAGTCCMELAELYEEQKEWHNAVHYYQEATDYYGETTKNPYYSRYCDDKAQNIGRAIALAKLM